MKKAISVVLAIILLCSLLSVSPLAASAGQLKVSDVSGKQGDIVTVNISIANNPGLVTLSMAVSYDTAVLELTGVTDTKLIGGNPPLSTTYTSPYTVAWADYNATADVTKNGTIAQFKFKIKDTAEVGTTKVTVAFNDSYKNDMSTENSFTGGSGTVTIQCKTHSYGGWSIISKADCSTDGKRQRTCSKCGAVENEVIAKLGHTYGAWQVTKEATCTEKGSQTRTCTRAGCGHKETKAIAALGHNFANATVTKEPTCTEAGVKTGTCTRCRQTTTEKIKATGHKFGNWEDEKAATCKEGGVQKRICSTCQHVENRNTKPIAHDFAEPVVVKEATLYSTGVMEGKCKVCGETTQQAIPCGATDAATGTVLETEAGVFAEGTTVAVTEITDETEKAAVAAALKEITSTFKTFQIAAMLNGAKVQPNGSVTLTLVVPEDFSENIELYDVSGEVAERLEAVLSEDKKTVTVTVTALGSLAICDLSADGTAQDPGDNDSDPTDGTAQAKKTDWLLYVAIGEAVIIVAAAVVIFLLLKKIKTLQNAETDTHES